MPSAPRRQAAARAARNITHQYSTPFVPLRYHPCDDRSTAGRYEEDADFKVGSYLHRSYASKAPAASSGSGSAGLGVNNVRRARAESEQRRLEKKRTASYPYDQYLVDRDTAAQTMEEETPLRTIKDAKEDEERLAALKRVIEAIGLMIPEGPASLTRGGRSTACGTGDPSHSSTSLNHASAISTESPATASPTPNYLTSQSTQETQPSQAEHRILWDPASPPHRRWISWTPTPPLSPLASSTPERINEAATTETETLRPTDGFGTSLFRGMEHEEHEELSKARQQLDPLPAAGLPPSATPPGSPTNTFKPRSDAFHPRGTGCLDTLRVSSWRPTPASPATMKEKRKIEVDAIRADLVAFKSSMERGLDRLADLEEDEGW